MTSLHASNCQIINPGSLGQPRDGKGFSYFIIDFITGNTFSNLILYVHLTPAINQYKHNLEMTVL
jgi:hypothetical protein